MNAAAVMGVLVVIAMGITIAIFIVYLLYRRRSGSISVDSDGELVLDDELSANKYV